MANMRIIGFNDRTAELRRIRLGYEGDNLVERLEFMLPEIAQGQTATLLITGADAVKLDRTDDGRYAVDLTRDMIGPDGEREAYVRVDGAGGQIWQSAPMRLITGKLPDVEEEIEKVYPTAVGQMLTAMAEHSGKMAAQEERIEQEADRAERAADALNDPDVVARTLVPEGEASAEWTVVDGKPTLTLNIPRGKPGDKGDKGDKGDRGYTPVKGIDYTDGKDGVGIADITVERAINPDNRDMWEVTFKTTDGKETSYVVADGKDGRTPVKGLDYTDGAPGPGITSLTVTERTDFAGRRYHQVVIMWEEAFNGSIIKAGQSFNVYDGTDGEKGEPGERGKSGVHYGPDEPTDPEVDVWINPEGEGEYIDATLTQAGKAADAKAVGDKLDGIDKSVYVEERGKNLVNPDTVVHGFLSNANGTILTSDSNANYETSDFIPVEPNTNYNLVLWNESSNSRATARKSLLLYDSAKNPIPNGFINQNNVAEIVFNTGAASYVRVCGQTYRFVENSQYKRVLQLEKGSFFTGYEAYFYEKKLRNAYPDIIFGKTWAACGDSFTNGGYTVNDGFDKSEYTYLDGPFVGRQITYARIIASRNNMQLLPFCQNGRTLANPADGTVVNSMTNPESDGYYQKIPEDTDYITLYFGINDSHHEDSESGVIPLGTIDDSDVSTFCGAWNVVLPWLMANRPKAHIGIIVSNGVDRRDYRTATIAAAKKWGIPYLDLNGDERCPAMVRSVNPDISAEAKAIINQKWQITTANGHPNVAAHYYEATFIENWLRSL